MAIDVVEVGEVFVVKDLKFSTYEEGEELLHEATYGFYRTYDAARRATKLLENQDWNLPRGSWHIYSEIVYE
jgi:hypothetical protein